jgi:hypothetical protein
MDCLKCDEMDETYFPFHDGKFAVIMYCTYYKAPCERAKNICKIEKLDRKILDERYRID